MTFLFGGMCGAGESGLGACLLGGRVRRDILFGESGW